jgi:plastocyanin
MKNILISKIRLIGATLMLLAILGVTNSCKKSTDTAGANEVYIEGMAFTPSTITVTVNATVTWTNKDGMAHTVTSNTDLFDSGSIPANGTYSHTFTTIGSFPYKCLIHSSMTGTVIVNSVSGGVKY